MPSYPDALPTRYEGRGEARVAGGGGRTRVDTTLTPGTYDAVVAASTRPTPGASCSTRPTSHLERRRESRGAGRGSGFMYRAAALPSPQSLDAAAARAVRFAQRGRALAMVACAALGVGAGLFALGQLQEWALVFMLAYAGCGLAIGFAVYFLLGRPALRLALHRRLERLAAQHGVRAEDLGWTHAYLA